MVPVPADCVRLAAVIAPAVTLPADTTVIASRAVVPPTALDSVILPVPAFKVRSCAPLTLPAKVISPAPAPVFRVMSPVRLTAPAKPMAVLAVVMLAPMPLAPVPVWLKPPSAEMVAAAVVVSWPLLATWTEPVVANGALTVRLAPVNANPPESVVESLNVVVPVPAAWVKLAALSVEEKRRSSAEPTEIAPSVVVAPTGPENSRSRPEALRAPGPSSAPVKVRSPSPRVNAASPTISASASVTASSLVLTVALTFVRPAVRVRPPSKLKVSPRESPSSTTPVFLRSSGLRMLLRAPRKVTS